MFKFFLSLVICNGDRTKLHFKTGPALKILCENNENQRLSYFLLKSRTGFYTYSLEAPYCAFLHFWVWSFVWTSVLSFFLSCFPCLVFFPLLIYLFIFYIMLLLGSWLIKSNLTDAFFSCTIMFTLPLERGTHDGWWPRNQNGKL